MKIVDPRRLALALLPALAAALYLVNNELLHSGVRLVNARNYDAVSTIVLFLGFVAGPMLTALVFAYPLGRVYAGRAGVAGLAIALPSIAYALQGRLGDPVGNLSLVVAFGVLGLAMPVVAMLAARALAGSRLVVADATAADTLPGTDPRALRWALLPLLAIAFFILDDLVQPAVWDIAILADTPWIERTGLMAGTLVGPGLVALMLAYPIARVYERHAALVGALVAAPTAWHWARIHLGDEHSRFWDIGYTIQVLAMVVLAALFAEWLQRRLVGSRLRVVAAESAASG